ncbi:Phosphoenolpyruvate/pyruvate domain-containing protein [Ramaria rubella]|nr:Phosphoenolpyruvate/pyruvate domain-containing protein [Ramaria rubella]
MAHPLLRSLRSATPAFGAWLTLPSPHSARQIALAGRSSGLSWVCIDCEHGLTPLVPGVADTIAAISSLPGPQTPSILVRIPAPGLQHSGLSTSYQIKQALDAGAHGIVVPMVSSAEIARQIALDARFPPVGRRGHGSPFAHQTWGVTDAEYLGTKANDEVVVCVQIESRDAVENLEGIATTNGIDVLFIGPFDLSLALGYPTPNPYPHPEVEKVVQRIKNVAHKHQKKVAYYCTSGELAKQRADDGFDILTVSSDVGALAEGLTRNLATANGKEAVIEPKRGY